MIPLAIRNLKLYFRDRTAVFFSLLAVFIIIGLYVLFLGDTITADLTEIKGARFLMDSWIMAGLLAVTSVTTTMGAASVVVDDQSKGVAKDFHCSPLTRTSIVGGYLISTIIVGVIMSMVALVLAEVYILVNGGGLLPVLAMLKVIGLVLLSVIASGSMVFFLISFFKTQNAFAVASTIIGTLIGFLTGIYVPISVLPSPVQAVIRVFSISHAPALFRQVFMEVPLAQSFMGAPPEIVAEFKTSLGVVFQFGDYTLGAFGSIWILILTALVFFALGVWRMLTK